MQTAYNMACVFKDFTCFCDGKFLRPGCRTDWLTCRIPVQTGKTSSQLLRLRSDSPSLRCRSQRHNLITANTEYDSAHESPFKTQDRRQLFHSAMCSILSMSLAQSVYVQGALAEQSAQAVDDEGKVELLPKANAAELSLSEKQILEYNKRIQAQNRVPRDFPWFVREGFDVKVLADDFETTPEGLMTRTFQLGAGPRPSDGQKAVFHYTAYNESGSPIDSSYKQGRPAEMRVGASSVIPGFELAIKGMEVGTKMRVIIPPALGPPVGPSTFFSAKQCEVFDVEMLALKNCSRKQFGMVSNIVCEDS
uniref:peptidylprolyl isomerase n=1 Tax=Tetraselmis sp. GSL018 TaxID=582737 RepID=A0A061R0F0_9CHLO